MLSRWLGLACAALLALACSDDDSSGAGPHPCQNAPDPAALRDCSTRHYLRDYAPLSQPSCAPSGSPIAIAADLDLELFRGVGISDPAVVEQTHALQRYFEPHELWFFTNAPASAIPLSHPMDGSDAQLRQALIDAGIPLDRPLSPEEEAIANQIIGDVVFAPIRNFVLTHAVPKQSRVIVITVSRIVAPALEGSLTSGLEIAGLGLSPALLDAVTAEDPQNDLYELLGLPNDFTPLLFVASGITRKYTKTPDNLVAHEMGHALGLVHQQLTGNLMTQGSPLNCRTTIDASQTGTLVLPQVNAAIACPRRLFELRRRIFERLLPHA